MNRAAVLAVVLLASLAPGCRKAPKSAETQPAVDPRNTNYQPGAGAMINSARAGKRVAAMHDFDQLKVYIFAFELENRRMATKDELRAELKEAPNLSKHIDEGAILLPTQPQKEGLWAYEVDADKVGGIVIVANAVSRATADDVKKLLGQK